MLGPERQRHLCNKLTRCFGDWIQIQSLFLGLLEAETAIRGPTVTVKWMCSLIPLSMWWTANLANWLTSWARTGASDTNCDAISLTSRPDSAFAMPSWKARCLIELPGKASRVFSYLQPLSEGGQGNIGARVLLPPVSAAGRRIDFHWWLTKHKLPALSARHPSDIANVVCMLSVSIVDLPNGLWWKRCARFSSLQFLQLAEPAILTEASPPEDASLNIW